jgi:hypothetical protein
VTRPTLASVLAALTPAQRESLAARNPGIRAVVGPSAARADVARPVAVEVRATARGVTVTLAGLRLVNAPNAREHWAARARRAKRERALVAAALATCARHRGPWTVTLTRAGRGTMDDDGLAAACKALRDAVAAWLGCDDSPTAPVVWRYAQLRGEPAVCITIDAGE